MHRKVVGRWTVPLRQRGRRQAKCAKRRQAEARVDRRRQANWDKVQGDTSLDELLRSGARFRTIVLELRGALDGDDQTSTIFARALVRATRYFTIDKIRELPIAGLTGE